MITIKERVQKLILISILISVILLTISSSAFSMENSPVETVQSNAGITFTEKESSFQVRPENNEINAGNLPGLGGDGSNISGENQSSKSIFPQTGERSTTVQLYIGLLIITILISYICYKKYKKHRKKE